MAIISFVELNVSTCLYVCAIFNSKQGRLYKCVILYCYFFIRFKSWKVTSEILKGRLMN